MKKELDLVLAPEVAFDPALLERELLQQAGITQPAEAVFIHKIKRSIDARGRKVQVKVRADVYLQTPDLSSITPTYGYPELKPDAKRVLIVGAGSAGLFAALRCIELGLKPVVVERGKDVRSRRRDLAAINKEHLVNPDSNYCFGEGGAGTYSDGKLYTRSKKRGDVQRILQIMVQHGATPDILFDAHPHIGTNKLPILISEIRETILAAGGEIHFNTRVTDFILEKNQMEGVVTASGSTLEGEAVILATGHSARDIYELLQARNILIEAKPFAMGVRVEHQQSLIDGIQYHCDGDRGPHLPAASYALVHQVPFKGQDRGVFSFCMCPGGFIVPSATAPGEVVVNGMSPSRRDSKFANSGIVVAVNLEDMDLKQYGALAGLRLQQALEQKACSAAGGTQVAPAQGLQDFVKGKVSASLLDTSYQPGLASVDMLEVLPPMIGQRLRGGFQEFGYKMRGYLTNEAQIVGVESRTSSPVRIPRDKETLQHPQIQNLFPCAEGAGYAGGIISAAMDGERCAEQVAVLVGR
ncbi:NAD(P)/FAD-dependent oxidoreductase [Rufibacter glacialis]|uniref:FAD-binding protein n=1 Tax=Rufibacter glacialis TaxID=1259555 RepID=A0A5M8QH63_9BACT|nr:FAD-dependent oxidoreductase [Rufibacter glacialis]KAA6434270.1 FAD-binding protein [Rufibacter glacialis]GGK68187.1 FAD-dependent dehydrogenase [Rufibacter glacialis]